MNGVSSDIMTCFDENEGRKSEDWRQAVPRDGNALTTVGCLFWLGQVRYITDSPIIPAVSCRCPDIIRGVFWSGATEDNKHVDDPNHRATIAADVGSVLTVTLSILMEILFS